MQLVSIQSNKARLVVVVCVGKRSCAVDFKRCEIRNGLGGFYRESIAIYRNESLALEAAAAWLEAAV